MKRQITEFPNYVIRYDGAVFNTKTGKRMSASQSSNGYWHVTLSKDNNSSTISIHVLVLQHFSGPRPLDAEARHLDGNKSHNHFFNLRWGTRSENMQDQIRHGHHHYTRRNSCINNHEFTPKNSYIYTHPVTGHKSRKCRECRHINKRRALLKRKAELL